MLQIWKAFKFTHIKCKLNGLRCGIINSFDAATKMLPAMPKSSCHLQDKGLIYAIARREAITLCVISAMSLDFFLASLVLACLLIVFCIFVPNYTHSKRNSNSDPNRLAHCAAIKTRTTQETVNQPQRACNTHRYVGTLNPADSCSKLCAVVVVAISRWHSPDIRLTHIHAEYYEYFFFCAGKKFASLSPVFLLFGRQQKGTQVIEFQSQSPYTP